MPSFISETIAAFHVTYLIARYGLKGAEERLNKENQRLIAELKGEKADVTEHNKET